MKNPGFPPSISGFIHNRRLLCPFTGVASRHRRVSPRLAAVSFAGPRCTLCSAIADQQREKINRRRDEERAHADETSGVNVVMGIQVMLCGLGSGFITTSAILRCTDMWSSISTVLKMSTPQGSSSAPLIALNSPESDAASTQRTDATVDASLNGNEDVDMEAPPDGKEHECEVVIGGKYRSEFWNHFLQIKLNGV
ncbi:hypothetical protein Dimus_021119 [Dionaea muscipula]